MQGGLSLVFATKTVSGIITTNRNNPIPRIFQLWKIIPEAR